MHAGVKDINEWQFYVLDAEKTANIFATKSYNILLLKARV